MVVLKSDPELAYTEFSDNDSSVKSLNSSNTESSSSYSIYNYDEVPENKSWASTLPIQKGLYNPEYEKDNCGVGMYYYYYSLLIFSKKFLNTNI
jgi:glutamate synthase (NADPH/NADH)